MRGGVLMLTISTYLRWMDVGKISGKGFNEGEDILEDVLNEVLIMNMLLYFFKCMFGLGKESLVVIVGVE